MNCYLLRKAVFGVSCATLALSMAGSLSAVVVVDNFSVGQAVFSGHGEAVQTMLDPNAVAGGVRKVNVAETGDTLEILQTGGLTYSSYHGYGFSLEYGSEQPLGIDTGEQELDRLYLQFSGSEKPAARLSDLYVNLPPTGSDNGLFFGSALFSLGKQGRIEFLLADVPASTGSIEGIIIEFARASGEGGFTLEEIALASTPINGDYNRDGTIDHGDYQEWARLYGGSSRDGSRAEAYLTADGNYDGVVDAADYVIWRDAYSAVAGTHSIPEPGSLVLAVAFMTLAGRLRDRR